MRGQAPAPAQLPALVLTGSRQSGKTALLKHDFADAHYASLDLPAEAQLADEAGDEFLRRHPPPVIIDEVQYAPGLFRFLKHVTPAKVSSSLGWRPESSAWSSGLRSAASIAALTAMLAPALGGAVAGAQLAAK